MGLLLSILVTCVGVVELLAFYRRVNGRVHYQPAQTGLSTVHDQYLKELERVRDRLSEQLTHLKQLQEAAAASLNAPTLTLNISEDVEVEKAKSRSSTPMRYLVSSSEKDFVAPEGIKKSRAQECLPEYLIEKEDVGPVPLPLSERFLADELEPKNDVFRKKIGHNLVEVDGELFFRRSPSPFPSFKLTAPRNSICSETLDDSAVCEVDEPSRSNSHSPINLQYIYESNEYTEINNNSEKVSLMLNESISAHSSTDFWDHKALAVPARKTKSKSQSPVRVPVPEQKHANWNLERRRSLSESNVNLNYRRTIDDGLNSSNDDDEFVEAETFTEETRNNLQGVDVTKGCIKKKYVKRKRIKNRPFDTNKLGVEPLLKSEKALESNSLNALAPQIKTGSPKPGEPFWVNR